MKYKHEVVKENEEMVSEVQFLRKELAMSQCIASCFAGQVILMKKEFKLSNIPWEPIQKVLDECMKPYLDMDWEKNNYYRNAHGTYDKLEPVEDYDSEK